MKTLIIYHSQHHGNTKKLVEAIAGCGDVTLAKPAEAMDIQWPDYELIGFASGIYYHQFHETILNCAKEFLPYGKNVFFLYTCGVKQSIYIRSIQQIADSKHAKVMGSYGCPGFDTFGPFRLIGGIAKGRPNDKDLNKGIRFFMELIPQ